MTEPARPISPTPRPPGKEAQLLRIWATPRGWRLPSAVNNTVIGLIYLGAALLFFVLAGILALLIRLQLAQPDGHFIGQELYNQMFTVHGTTMMFLFAMMNRLTLTGSTLRPQSGASKGRMAKGLGEKVWPLLEAGKVKPIIYKTFPLKDAAGAHAELERADHVGKVMLAV